MANEENIEIVKRRRPRTAILQEWFEVNGNSCPVCGRTIDSQNCMIEHIYPYSMGGTDEINNLRVLCGRCNTIRRDRPFLDYQFEEYVKQLLEANNAYVNISKYRKINDKVIDADIIFEKADSLKKSLFVAEVSVAPSFTQNEISKIVKRLLEHKEKAAYIAPVFITPSEIPQKYMKTLNKNGIELWDKSFIENEFYSQILETEESRFRAFFDLSKKAVDEPDEFLSLIDELKQCPSGWDNWVIYQKLVRKILGLLLCPPLDSPIPQSSDKTKRNRRDYILPNYSRENDIWEFLRNRYSADFIVVDAKNSGKYISKEDILQIANYLKKDGAGLFGIIIARKGTNDSSEDALRDAWIHQQKMIVVLNDDDIEQMILSKKNGGDPARLILDKIQDFRLLI